ncbi:MAG: sugar transferase, partial [Kamptonema sp. SIO4C4]|nr:sugar transferase [Kamptonema sp. SIO4C4]
MTLATSAPLAFAGQTSQPQSHPSTRSNFKRILDMMGSLVGLLIVALLFLPIAVAIKLESPGPIFFKQKRYGLHGQTFTLYKFRSMYIDAEERKKQIQNQVQGLLFKNENDPRITKVGRFLRAYSLDELPQFWNVWRGDMSLVGTRPPTEDEVMQYSEHHWKRLNVKPGITGQWQVSGRSSIKDFEEVVQLDLHYAPVNGE